VSQSGIVVFELKRTPPKPPDCIPFDPSKCAPILKNGVRVLYIDRVREDYMRGAIDITDNGLTTINPPPLITHEHLLTHAHSLTDTPHTHSVVHTHSVSDMNHTHLLDYTHSLTDTAPIPIPIPCYCKGTLILTNKGNIKIEDIKKDDLVVRKGIIRNGILKKHVTTMEVPVIWIKSFKVKKLDTKSRPICITKNALRRGDKMYPFEDLYVSPGHRLLMNNKIFAASDLINGKIIYQDNKCESVEYYHLECEEHSAIYANGVLAETYIDSNREIFDTE
jgi:hypothetical protein